MTSSEPGVRRRRSTVTEPTPWGRMLLGFAVLIALAGVGSIGVFTGSGPPVKSTPPPIELSPPEEQLAAVRLGVTPACGPALECLAGLADVYGIDLSDDLAEYPDSESLLTALRREAVLVAAVPATEPDLLDGELVALEDDLAMTSADRLVVVSRSNPSAAAVLEAVTEALTTERLQAWISQVRTGGDLADITATAATVLELSDDLPEGAPGSPTTRIAVSNSERDQVVGAIYAASLRARGHSVEVVDSGGAPGHGHVAAIAAGDADVVVATATEVLVAYGGVNGPSTSLLDLDHTHEGLEAALARAEVPLAVLSASGPFVGLHHVVTEDIAERFGLRRLSDLISAAPPVAPLDPG